MSDTDSRFEVLQAVQLYLARQGLHRTADCLQREAELAEPTEAKTELLEERWAEVDRLRARVRELELLLAQPEQPKSALRASFKNVPGLELVHPRLRLEGECSGHKEAVMAVALHPAEAVFASGSADCFVRLFDYELQTRLALLRGHTQPVRCVAWAGDVLVSGSADMSLRVWESLNKASALSFADFGCVRTLIGHEHAVAGIVNLPDSDLTVSCSRDTTLRLWDRSTGACRRTVRAHNEWVRCLDANDQHLASAGNDRRLLVFGLQRLVQHEGGDVAPLHAFEVHENYVEAVKLQKSQPAAGEDQAAFTAARDKTVRMWNYIRGQLLRTFTGHHNWVLALAALEEGALLLSAGEDRTLRIWDARRGEQLHAEADAHQSFIFCVDYRATERLLATGGADRSVRLWRIFNAAPEETVRD